MRDIHLSVLTPADLSQLSLAKLALSAILETHEDLRPKRIGNWEPLKQKADDHTTIDDFLANWAHPFLWNHAKRSEGAIFLGGGNRHSAIYLSCMSTRVQPSAIAQLARRVSSELNADFASVYVHYEMGDAGRRRYDALYPLIRGVTTHDLRNSLPDLPWFTVFGPPYLDLLGSARLLSCPAYAVGEQPTGSVWIQLTEDPRETRLDAEPFEIARKKAKEHLGLEHFLDLERPDAQRTAPTFPWAIAVRSPSKEYLRKLGSPKE